jgi:hypothetical protein
MINRRSVPPSTVHACIREIQPGRKEPAGIWRPDSLKTDMTARLTFGTAHGCVTHRWTGHGSTPKRHVTKCHTETAPAATGRRRKSRRSSSWPTPYGLSCWPARQRRVCTAGVAAASAAIHRAACCPACLQSDYRGRPRHQQLAQPFIAGSADAGPCAACRRSNAPSASDRSRQPGDGRFKRHRIGLN